MLLFVEILQNLILVLAMISTVYCLVSLFTVGFRKREFPPYPGDSEDDAFFDDEEIDAFDVFDDSKQEDKSDDHTC